MDHAYYWLAVDIARKALRDITEDQRAAVMAESAACFDGPDAIETLSKLRAAVSLRMQQLIDEKFPLHETAQVYGDVPAVHARATTRRGERRPRNFFDLSGYREARNAQLARRREDNLERAKEVLGILQGVVVAPSFGSGDQSFDAVAQRLAVLIFGEQ